MNPNKNNKKRQQNKNLIYGFSFLGSVFIIYLLLSIFDLENVYKSLQASLDIIIQILPILILVILMMLFVNLLLKPKTVSKLLGGESGLYVWYPLLKNLKDSGMKSGLVAVFLYNRAVKIPLLPVMIYYFGIGFALILTFYMIIASLLEGKIIEITEHKFKDKGIKDV